MGFGVKRALGVKRASRLLCVSCVIKYTQCSNFFLQKCLEKYRLDVNERVSWETATFRFFSPDLFLFVLHVRL